MSEYILSDRDELEKQLILAGWFIGMSKDWNSSLEEIRAILKDIDPDFLEEYLKTNPETKGFSYRTEVERVIRITRTLKSFSNG